MQIIRLAALISLGLATSAMADDTVPADFQGVWASARDCKDDFQNVRQNVVDREFAVCRVVRVAGSAHPEARTSAVTLNCGAGQSREIWHEETVDDTDTLVIARFEPGTETGISLDVVRRCPGIPLAEIPLAQIPGNPETASEVRIVSPPVHSVRRRSHPHGRTGRVWKHNFQ